MCVCVSDVKFGIDILLLDAAAAKKTVIVTSVFGELYSIDDGKSFRYLDPHRVTDAFTFIHFYVTDAVTFIHFHMTDAVTFIHFNVTDAVTFIHFHVTHAVAYAQMHPPPLALVSTRFNHSPIRSIISLTHNR